MDPGEEPSVLLEEVLGRIGESSESLAAFARAYLHRLPSDTAISPEAAYGEVTGLFDLISERSGAMSVRVLNPTLDTHGYDSPGSVVEIHVDDAPFLVDSITAELRAHGLGVVRVLHPVIGVVRDESGRLVSVRRARDAAAREAIQHYVLDRRLDPIDHPALAARVEAVLTDVLATVRDFPAMLEATDRMAQLALSGKGHYSDIEVSEAVAFLEWLTEDNFVFLGYREYRITDTPDGQALELDPASGLGILSDPTRSKVAEPLLLTDLPPELRARYDEGDLLVLSKTNRLSTVHRRTRMDYVGIRIVGTRGETVGEARLLGLFTGKAYNERVARIPVLRQKLAEIASSEDLVEGSHDHKAIVTIIESYPKDELFALPTDDLRRVVIGLLALETRPRVRLFVRRGVLDRGVRILVAMPRDRYTAELRNRLEALFLDRFGGISVDYHLTLEETEVARLHFVVWVPEGQAPEVAFDELEAEVMALTRSWPDRLADVLGARHDRDKAQEMVARWTHRLPDHYKTSTRLEVAAGDVEHLEELRQSGKDSLVGLQNEAEGPDPLTRVSLYRIGAKRALSELTPALEDMGLKVVDEIPTRLIGEESLYIHDFGVLGPTGHLIDIDEAADRVGSSLAATWEADAESDSLSRLVLDAGLDHHQVGILRAYRTYWRRVSPIFTVNYVNDALVAHPEIAFGLIRLFELRFDPTSDGTGYGELREELLARLDAVPSLDEDRILRGFFGLIEATVRTNAYRPDRRCLAFKLRSAEVPEMPAPRPHAEVFVIGDLVEGVHLRAGPQARGGIRWSERREDYRTEVLGLMKAQVTKNAIIVPTGAKGGFVLRRRPVDQEELREAVRSAYEVLIRGLLDVTDNMVDGVVVLPQHLRVHDGDDPYLVVAADKGTARFSDIANRIAEEYGFWLGDAFASGGATGYDHKALGITARGAWKSLEAHCAEDGLNPLTQSLTGVGIGDMSGDVFGNGMLISRAIRLVAAFDHRHIFLDPDPDPEVSFRERRRLFELADSTWADYDPGLISDGGGVFSRASKRIELSEEARSMLGTDVEAATPAELIRVILQAPVDLIWNGGIGTFVKAAAETHEEVGDRSNDSVRVNGSELRARMVVEGGNLGFTQRGRVEYALGGGRINTDFIDNSGGVNCSDREVNLKILLRLAERRGEIDGAESHDLLAAEAAAVVEAILHDSLDQAQMLAREERASAERMDAYEQLMTALEDSAMLDRQLEHLPSTQQMAERARAGGGLTRPELAVLSAYAKIALAEEVLSSGLPDSTRLLGDLARYFPGAISKRFGDLLWDHPLRRELIATIVANNVVNHQGPTFVARLATHTGADLPSVTSAYCTAREFAGGMERRRAVEVLFGVVDYEIWLAMIEANDRLIAGLTRWFLRHPSSDIAQIEGGEFRRLEEEGAEWGSAQKQLARKDSLDGLRSAGVPDAVGYQVTIAGDLVHAPNILEVGRATGRSRAEVGTVFHRVGELFALDSLEEALANVKPADPWQRWARETVEDDLLDLRRSLTERILAEGEGSVEEGIETFLAERADSMSRVRELVGSLQSGTGGDPTPILVVVRQIQALAEG